MIFTRWANILYIERCLALAAQAAENWGSTVVGVVLRNGVIIGEGAEKSKKEKHIARMRLNPGVLHL